MKPLHESIFDLTDDSLNLNIIDAKTCAKILSSLGNEWTDLYWFINDSVKKWNNRINQFAIFTKFQPIKPSIEQLSQVSREAYGENASGWDLFNDIRQAADRLLSFEKQLDTTAPDPGERNAICACIDFVSAMPKALISIYDHEDGEVMSQLVDEGRARTNKRVAYIWNKYHKPCIRLSFMHEISAKSADECIQLHTAFFDKCKNLCESVKAKSIKTIEIVMPEEKRLMDTVSHMGVIIVPK